MTTSHRPHAPARDASAGAPGVDGNARLTAVTGTVLLVLLAIEGVTVLDVEGMITLHVYLGLVLLGPVLLKTASTGYRFARYYAGSGPYVRKGPPPIVLRVLGPVVIVSSLALLGTGVALIASRPGDGWLMTAHQASFIVWVAVMTIHVLWHLREMAVLSWAEVRRTGRGRRWRLAAVALVLAAGVGTASALLPTASSWINRPHGSEHHQGR